MHILIGELIGLQETLGDTDKKFAERLGIDRSTWSHIKNGKRGAGVKFLKSVANTFPEYKRLVAAYIDDNVNLNPWWRRIFRILKK